MTRTTHLAPRPGHLTPRTSLLVALSLVLTFTSVGACRGGTISYVIQNYPAQQSGYNLSGTITTDGVIGALTNNDILSWTLAVTGGSNAFTASGTGPGQGVISSGASTTSTGYISLADPGPSGRNTLLLVQMTTSSEVVWAEGGAGFGEIPEYVGEKAPSAVAWATSPSTDALGGAPWIIAQAVQTVPEPGTLSLALLGTACLAVVEWSRRCRRAASRSPGIPPAHS
jgi:hypothetical protein